nr:hypothetical protein [Sphingomonas daechungensis]
MTKYWLKVLPSVLLPGHILPILAAVGKIVLPKVVETLGSWSVKLLPDLPCDYSGETRVRRASRDPTASLSRSDSNGELASVWNEFIFFTGRKWAHSYLSTSRAGMRKSLPSGKAASSPRWIIWRTFSALQLHRSERVSGV